MARKTKSPARGAARAATAAADNARRVRELKRQLRELQSGESTRAEVNKVRQAFERERELWKRGIVDAEDVAAVETLYSRLPAKDRPALKEWLDNHSQNLESAPKVLRALLTPADPKTEAKTDAKPPASTASRTVPRTVDTSPAQGSGGAVTVEAIRAAGERARTERTPEAIAAFRAISAQLASEKGRK